MINAQTLARQKIVNGSTPQTMPIEIARQLAAMADNRPSGRLGFRSRTFLAVLIDQIAPRHRYQK